MIWRVDDNQHIEALYPDTGKRNYGDHLQYSNYTYGKNSYG